MSRTPSSPEDQPVPDHATPERNLILDIFGTLVTFQVRSTETDGAYSILEMVVPAGRTKPQMHVHAATETFQILEGEFEFRAIRDDHTDVFRAASADIVHIPPNVPHCFRNVAKTASSMQVVIAPGLMEGYFLELGMPTAEGVPVAREPDMKLVAAVGRKYGIELGDPE